MKQPSALSVFSFESLAPGGYLTFVSAASLKDAWEMLSKDAYKDCDVHSRYRLIHECADDGEGEALEVRGPRNEDQIPVKS